MSWQGNESIRDEFRIRPGEEPEQPYPTNHTKGDTMTTTATRRQLQTVLAEAARERDVPLETLEQRFAEAFTANRDRVASVPEMATAIGTALNLPITAGQVRSWMKRYGKTIEHASSSATATQLRQRVAELEAENTLLRQSLVDLRSWAQDNRDALDAWVANADAWVRSTESGQ